MKKFFIAALLLPFFLFADTHSLSQDDFIDIQRISIYTFTSFSTSNSTYSSQRSIDPSSVFSLYYNSVNGVKFSSDSRILRQPSFSYPVSTNTHPADISFPVQANTVFSSTYGNYSLFAFNRVLALYNSVISLYAAGYRGSGFRDIYLAPPGSASRFGNVAINFYFPDIVSDILVSTNSTFSKILFDSLSSIDSNLSLLSSNLASFQQSYQSVNLPAFDFSKYLESLLETGSASQSNVDSWQATYDQFSYDPALQRAFAQSVQNTIDFNHQAERTLQTLQESAQGNPSQLRDIGNSFNGSVEGAVQDFKRLSTNWQEGVKKDLQDWRNDVTNRLAHMFDDNVPIDGGNVNPVFVSGLNGGPVGVTGVVQIQGPLSVGATIEGAVTLDSTQFYQFSSGWESIRQSIIDFHNSFSDFTSSGDLPFNWISFYRLFYDFQNQSLTNQVALLHNLNYTNILENIYVAITNKDTNVVISAVLLDDYENFVDTSKFSSIVSSLPDNLRDSLSRFGLLDSSDYSGRWWVFQAANMALQSQLALTNAALASLLSSSLQSLDDYFSDDEDPSSGLLSSWLNIIDGLPDPEELQQTISEATNIVSNVGLERVTVLYDRATNDFSSVVSSVYSDRSLPPTLSFVLLPGKNGSPDRVVNIPVSDRSSLWSFIRQGMAFGLSVVTLILFPKYLLWLLAHYTRLLEKIIKSLHAYTEH